MELLAGKTAIVTGASRGIGRSIALLFARRGARVVVTARTTDALEVVVDEVREAGSEALAITADLAKEADIHRVVDTTLATYGSVDILINNAAVIHPPVELASFDIDVWRHVIDVNLTAPALLIKAALPNMIEKRSGTILNISSIGGRKGARGRSAYRATKAGLINLTESVAAEVKEWGIEVNCICPGGVDTEGFREAFGNRGREDNPKLMLPEEIAELALFLASDQSTAVTGAAIDAFGASNPLFG
jgi:NAD(P)-dependent dehydrogenase (short-subunit alcohol dehydrogenase family)